MQGKAERITGSRQNTARCLLTCSLYTPYTPILGRPPIDELEEIELQYYGECINVVETALGSQTATDESALFVPGTEVYDIVSEITDTDITALLQFNHSYFMYKAARKLVMSIEDRVKQPLMALAMNCLLFSPMRIHKSEIPGMFATGFRFHDPQRFGDGDCYLTADECREAADMLRIVIDEIEPEQGVSGQVNIGMDICFGVALESIARLKNIFMEEAT